jgi:hypothetical protein
MLKSYNVGTNKGQFGLPPPRDPKDLGMLKDLFYLSTKTIAQNIRTGQIRNNNKL